MLVCKYKKISSPSICYHIGDDCKEAQHWCLPPRFMPTREYGHLWLFMRWWMAANESMCTFCKALHHIASDKPATWQLTSAACLCLTCFLHPIEKRDGPFQSGLSGLSTYTRPPRVRHKFYRSGISLTPPTKPACLRVEAKAKMQHIVIEAHIRRELVITRPFRCRIRRAALEFFYSTWRAIDQAPGLINLVVTRCWRLLVALVARYWFMCHLLGITLPLPPPPTTATATWCLFSRTVHVALAFFAS